MSFAHLTLAVTDAERTAAVLEHALGWQRMPLPSNLQIGSQGSVWLDLGRGQSIHIVYAPGFVISPFEGEFGRHFAVFHPLEGFPEVKRRLRAAGASIFHPERSTSFERFFFREPINNYVIEVIDSARDGLMAEK